MEIPKQIGSRWIRAFRAIEFNKSLLNWLGIIGTIAVVLVHLGSLTTYPVVDGDEPWFADAPWNFIQSGVLFDRMHTGPLDQFGYPYVRRYFLGTAPWMVIYAMLGLGLVQVRLGSLICGVVLMIAMLIVARKSYSTSTGVLAALLLALSPPFLHSSHFGRQDIMLAAVLMIAYAMTLVALQDNKGWAHFAAGLLVGLSVDVHQNGLFFAPAFAAIYLAHYGRSLLRQRGTWLAALGGALGLAYYLIVFILPSPDTYFKLYSFDFAEVNQIPFQSIGGIVNAVRTEIGRYRFYDNNLDFALIVAGFVYMLFRCSKLDRPLLIMVAVTFAVFALFRGSKTTFYAILLYPFMVLIVAETFVSLIRAVQLNLQRIFVAALLAMVIVNGALHVVDPITENAHYDYAAITSQIKSVIPPEARVMGLPTWWLGLTEYDYRSSLTIAYYHFFNNYDLEEILSRIRPDYVIVDELLRGVITTITEFTVSPNYGFPGDEFQAFLDEQGTVVLDFVTEEHGQIQVYAIHWDS